MNTAPVGPRRPRRISLAELEAACRLGARSTHGRRVLDLRAAGPGGALIGSARIPWSDRLPVFLLPARGTPLIVVADDAEARAGHLHRRGWPADWYDEPIPPALLGPLDAGGAAWEPDPLVVEAAAVLPDPEEGPVLDLGGGSSREGVYLAQRGWDVTVLDRLPDALDLAQARADHHGVTVQRLERRVRRPEDLPAGPWAAVLCFRFQTPTVLGGVASILRRGGVLVLRSYGHVERADGGPDAGPNRRRDRLGRDEAHHLLPDRDWAAHKRLDTVDEGAARWTRGILIRR